LRYIPIPIQQGDILQIGNTIFSIHVHEHWSCDLCSSSNQNILDLYPTPERIRKSTKESMLFHSKDQKEIERKKELQRLKNKYEHVTSSNKSNEDKD